MSEYGSLGETVAVVGATVVVVGAIGLGAYWLLERTNPSSHEGQVDIQLDDLAQLGEGVVFIGDQECPPTHRPVYPSESQVMEYQGGDRQGTQFVIAPEAVYNSSYAPLILCGPDAQAGGNPFEGNAIVIAGANTEFSEG